ncbi:MAG: MMPL family transporter [Methylomonas sp.]
MSFVWRKRWFLLLFPVLLAITTWQIRVETDLNAFFTATDDEDSRLLSGLLQSGELSRRYLLVVEKSQSLDSYTESKSPENNVSLAEFSARLVGQLAELQDVEQVWPANEPPLDWLEAIRSYAPYHARVFSLNPEEDGRRLFDPSTLNARAESLQQALLSPQGGFIKAIAKQDPLLLSLSGFKDMQGQFQQQSRQNTNGGALILQSRPPALDSDAHTRLQNDIRSRFDTLNAAAGGTFKLSMTGVPVFSVAAHSEIGQDVTLVSVVSSVLVALVFLLLFHSFSALHWVMMVQGASFVLGTLATAVVFPNVHSLTLALGASLIGISSDYPIHVMVHCAKHRNTPLSAARLLWPSLLLGGLTTVIGYGALGMTGFPGFEQIAVFAFASVAASLGLTRWVLPALLVKSSLHAAHLPGIAAWVEFCGRHRKVLLSLFAVGVVLAGLTLPHIRWMEDMQNLAVNMDEMKRQDATVRAHFSSVEPGRFVLIEADNMETALQRSEAAERRLQELKQAGIVSEYHGLFPWLVSEQLQAENMKVYQEALTPQFQDAWRAALTQAGLSVEKLGHLPAPSAEPLKPDTILKSPVRQILAGQMIAGQQGVILSLWLGDHDPDKLIAGLAGLEGTRYFSQKDQLDHIASKYRDRSLRMLAIGIAVMAVFIWLQQRDMRKVLLTLLPSLASVLFIFATWVLMGEEVSFLHVIGLLLSVSLCVDYGIFFMDNRGQDADITYHAIASSTLTTLASFGALGLGKTPTLPILALSVSLGVTLGFLLCPLLIQQKRAINV